MVLTNGSLDLYPAVPVAQPADIWLPNPNPPSNLELKLLDFLQSQLAPCAPGYRWDDETLECVPKIRLRSPKNCDYGFKKYGRMDECRRTKYNVGSQKGIFRQWWDRHIAPSPSKTTKITPVKIETTVYSGEWYGYGYDFGRNDPHW